MKKSRRRKPETAPRQSSRQQPENKRAGDGVVDTLLELGPLFLIGVSPFVFMTTGGEFENTPKMAFLQWGIVLLCLTKIIRGFSANTLSWKTAPLDIPIVLFYSLCLLSLLQAHNASQATLLLLHWGGCVVFYFFLVNTVTSPKSVDRFLIMTSAAMLLVSVIGIMQKLDLFAAVIHKIPQMAEPASTFSNKNMASQYIAIAFPLTLGALIISQRIRERTLCTVSLAVSVLYLLYTETRSAWLATVSVSTLFLVLSLLFFSARSIGAQLSTKKIGLTACLLAVTPGLLFLPPVQKQLNIDMHKVQDRFFSIGRGVAGTTKLRTIWWKNSFEMVQDHFFWGVGLGNFKINYPLYHRAVEKDWSFTEEHQLNRVHNDYLQMLVELGVFGALAYLSLFLIVFFLFMRLLLREKDKALTFRAMIVFLGILAFMIVALFTFPMERAMPPLYLFCLLALLSFLYTHDRQNKVRIEGTAASRTARTALCILLMVFFVLSVVFTRKVALSDKYFVEALTLGDRGAVSRANVSLKKAKTFPGWNFNIPSLLGRNYTKQGRYEEALEEYRQALDAHPYNINAILNTGFCYLRLKNYEKAEEYFQKFIDIVPDSSKGWNNMGIIFFSRKQYDKAIEYYRHAVSLEPEYAQAYFNLGNTYKIKNMIPEAIEAYRNAITYDPAMEDARKCLAAVLAETGDTAGARETLAPLLGAEKTSGKAYALLGTLYQNQGKFKKALNEYNLSLRSDPDNGIVYHNLGTCHYYLKEYESAEKAFRKALTLNPGIAESYSLLGQLYLRKKNDEHALALFLKALELNPGIRDARFNEATIYLRTGQYDKAVTAYEQTLAIDPGFSLAHYNLATILRHQEKYQQALHHFEKALVNPSPLINEELTRQFIAEMKKTVKQD